VGFVHLEVHSHFTLLGATPNVEELAARAAADGMSHLALTDTNALYGELAFTRACREAGVQPITGMVVTTAASEEHGPERVRSSTTPVQPGHLVLLATGPAGYRSLCRLSSLIQASPEREALAARGLTWDDLGAYREGLIALSGGRTGWVERHLRAGNHAAAMRYAGKLAGLYGENAYLGLPCPAVPGHVHRSDLYRSVAEEVIALGGRLGLPAVAVQPVYCMRPDEYPKLRLLAAIRRNCALDELIPEDLPSGDDPTVDLHWLGPEELARRYADHPEAVALAGDIAARCDPAFTEARPIWPVLKLPAGQTPEQALTVQAEGGLAIRYSPEPAPQVQARLAHELGAISEHGYAPLFLVVADITRFARQAGIPVSTRGSVANSLVAYCVGITTVDPVEHQLLFERFLNPARLDAPDIDLDLCSRRRDEVLAYVRDTYGPEHVAMVCTVSTMRPQSAVRETAKAHRLPDDQVERIMKLLPRGWHPDPRRRDRRTVDDVLAALDDPRLKEIVSMAYGLVGQPDHLSVHPGGIIITPGPLTDIVPVQLAPKGFLITQFEHGDVEMLGLPKIDLLGIRALTVLADTTDLVRAHYETGFRLEDIPLDDPLTCDLLERGDTIGVFQCESEGAQRTLRKLRARTVADLAIANAFFKPGPSTGGMASAFVRRYRGEERVTFLHPALAPILGPTKGVLIFQEQILRVAREIAGLTWAQADHLRRGMSKFRPDEMGELRDQFTAGCQRPPPDGPGFTAAQAQTLWEQVIPFAGYGFNQGHATAYADVSYRSAYLKAHWPAAFLCARLADWGGFHHPAVYIAEAIRLGIAVRPPHVNHSGAAFTLESDPRPVLWMGLDQVRDLRDSTIGAIVAARLEGPFVDLGDLVGRVHLQPKELGHLIRCGALDELGENRATLLAHAESPARAGQRLSSAKRRPGKEGPAPARTYQGHFMEQLAFPFIEQAAAVTAESPAERLAWEQRLLGWPVSVHPLSLIAGELPEHLPLRRLVERDMEPSPRGGTRELLTVAGVRLPGWTGGPGFFLGDGDSFVTVKGGRELKAPTSWRPLIVRGRWLGDGYGTYWLQAEQVMEIHENA
jgi:DNA polymerase-3 subunit alpha